MCGRSEVTDQYPIAEHVIILGSELRSTENRAAQQVHGCLSHQSRLVHEPVLHCTLHVRLGRHQYQSHTHTHTHTHTEGLPGRGWKGQRR